MVPSPVPRGTNPTFLLEAIEELRFRSTRRSFEPTKVAFVRERYEAVSTRPDDSIRFVVNSNAYDIAGPARLQIFNITITVVIRLIYT
jgi:hypothetical protein